MEIQCWNVIFWCCALSQLSNARLLFSGNLPKWNIKSNAKSAGDRLLLSPLIETGKVEDLAKARKMAKVDSSLFHDVTSYAGYLTVDGEFNSNLWFWFFPAEGTEHLYQDDASDEEFEEDDSTETHRIRLNETDWKNENRPVILWLQGGPGSSSLFGLFVENGPFLMGEEKLTIKKNPHSWHKKYSMIFIDQPVGTGFSFTERKEGYATNVTQSSQQLYTAMVQFFKLFPWLQHNEFYVAGESYAGKYIPGLANEIYEQNQKETFKLNLKGLAIGNGYVDPYYMMHYSDFAFQTGLIDRRGYEEMQVYEILGRHHIVEDEAKIYWDAVFFAFLRYSRYRNLYNILEPKAVYTESYLDFMNQPSVRKAVHVGRQVFASPGLVYYHMTPDFMNSAMPWVEKLLDNNKKLRIMFYSGNMDFIVAYPLSVNAFEHMNWSGAAEYRIANRTALYVNKELKGYVKKVQNFYDVMILNAGHMVPTDQPVAAFKMIDRFIQDTL